MSRSYLFCAYALAALAALAAPARADFWRPVGPYGASESNAVSAVLMTSSNPPIALAGTRLGETLIPSVDGTYPGELFRSIDEGATWQVVASWPGSGFLTLVQSPSSSNTIYAGTYAGFFRSLDAGRTWTASNSGFVDLANQPAVKPVQTIAVDPINPSILYAGTTDAGLFKSVDGGDTWTKSSTNLFFPGVRSVVVDPGNTSIVYASTDGGVFKSTDAAGLWSSVNSGLTNSLVRSLAIDPSNPNRLWAVVDTMSTAASVFATSNGGASWTLSSTGLSCSTIRQIRLFPSVPATLYVGGGNGVCISTDGGASWSTVSTGLTSSNVQSLAIKPGSPSAVLAGTKGGAALYKTINAGGAWAASSTGLHAMKVGSMIAGSNIYVGSPDNGGVFVGDWFGTAWNPANTGLDDLHVNALALSSIGADDVVFAGAPNKVFRGEVSTLSNLWQETALPLPTTNVSDLLVRHDDPMTMGDESALFVAADMLVKTTDEGTSWATSLFSTTRSIAAIDPRKLYTETVYRSVDNGSSWGASIDGLPLGRGLLVDTDGSSKAYLAYQVLADPNDIQYQVFSALDDGMSPFVWSPASTGLADGFEISALEVQSGATVWAGLKGSGVYRTTDGGGSWESVGTGLSNTRISRILSGASTLLATDSGVFVLDHCGDGVLDVGEQCDDGNILAGDCCSPACDFESAATVCRPADGSCDVAETCTGASATCPADASKPDGTSCDDGTVCTSSDQCLAGECGGSTISCDDGNLCTDDACNAIAGCAHSNNTAPCDDGDACTTGDACDGGACAGDLTVVCDDGNSCTSDACNPMGGCEFVNNSDPCDDGDTCTTGDQCSGGSCAPGAPVVCNDANGCTNDSCINGSGCTFLPNSNPCDDGNACSTNDTCVAGTCTGTSSMNCTDGNVCTTDSCDPFAGCIHTNNTRSCDDGNFQTCNDACDAGACVGDTNLNGCIDSFKCYRARATGFEKILGVELQDAYQGDVFFDVARPESVCNPVDRNGSGIGDGSTHLTCYDIKLTKADPVQPRFSRRSVTAVSALEATIIELRSVDRLCLPSTLDGAPSTLQLDAFKCYAGRNSDDAVSHNVTLSDQFVASSSGSTSKATSVCRPTSVNNRPILRADTSLACFKLRERSGFAGTTATFESELGATSVDVRKADGLCVPAGVTEVP